MSWQIFNDLVDVLCVLTVLYVQTMRYTSGNKPIYPELIIAIGFQIFDRQIPLNHVPTTIASLFPHQCKFWICSSTPLNTMRPVVQ
jgi:hypothetical protein